MKKYISVEKNLNGTYNVNTNETPSGGNSLFIAPQSYEGVLVITDIPACPKILSNGDYYEGISSLDDLWTLIDGDGSHYDTNYKTYSDGFVNFINTGNYIPIKIGDKIYVTNNATPILTDLSDLEYTLDDNYPIATYNGQVITPFTEVHIQSGEHITVAPVTGRTCYYDEGSSGVNPISFDYSLDLQGNVLVYSIDPVEKKIAIALYKVVVD